MDAAGLVASWCRNCVLAFQLLRDHGSIVSLCGADLAHVCEWSARLDSNATVVAFNGTATTTCVLCAGCG